jgi:pSer/pThr/pTyr-binding forkhead associated (FHA) protein
MISVWARHKDCPKRPFWDVHKIDTKEETKMIQIEVKFKDTVQKTLETDRDKITIGRKKNNTINIDNLQVSNKHARIVKHGENYFIEDLKSTNGTFLNNEKISKEPLRDKDTITIGKHTLVIHLEDKKDVKDLTDATYAV